MANFVKAGVLTGVGLAALSCGVAHAQAVATPQPAAASADDSNRIEDIVVTARRIKENLQSTPISITALSSTALEERNVTTLEKVGALAPNLAITQSYGFVGAINPWIRGIGMNDVQYGQDSPIGIYIDGVYSARTNNARFDLVELERIEVLRGPQGTLFGRNTTGGALNIVTRQPADRFGAEVTGKAGNYDTGSLRARLDTGLLGDTGVKATVAVQHKQNDGYVDNAFVSSKHDYGASNSDAVWAKLAGEWGPLSVTVSGDYSDLRATLMYMQGVVGGTNLTNFLNKSPTNTGKIYQFVRDYVSYTDYDAPPIQQVVKSRGISFTGEYEVSDAISLKSITAWRGFTLAGGAPTGPNGVTGLFGPTLATATIQTVPSITTIDPRHQRQSQFTQEAQVLGDLGDLKFVLGAFYYQERARDTQSTVTLVPLVATALAIVTPTDYSISNKSYAAFAQGSWTPAFAEEKLELTGGIRYTKDKKNIVQRKSIARTANTEPEKTSYLASVSYKFTPSIMTYARFATGYRAGGFNTRATGTTAFTYLPEDSKSYEVGFKADLFDRRVRLNGAIYQTDSTNLQVSQFGILTAQQLNANARYRGFELELTVVPTDGLTLNASVGHTQPKYKRLILGLAANLPVPPELGPQDPALRALGLVDVARIGEFPYVPHWTGGAGINYQLPASSYGTWSVRSDLSYTGNVHFQPTSLPTINPFANVVTARHYALVSGRVSLSDVKIGGSTVAFSLFGENLLDKHNQTAGVDLGAAIGFGTAGWGPPRTYGVEAKVAF